MRTMIASMCLILATAGIAQAKDWRGVRPLHSTRKDVERLLGQAKTSVPDTYELAAEVAVVLYSSKPCGKAGGSSWNVPAGTVLEIRVSPKTELRFTQLQIDTSKFERTVNALTPVHAFYINDEEGIEYTVFEGGGDQDGRILNITYLPMTKDEHLRCPKRAGTRLENQKELPYCQLDEYHDMPFSFEKERLDPLADVLKAEADVIFPENTRIWIAENQYENRFPHRHDSRLPNARWPGNHSTTTS